MKPSELLTILVVGSCGGGDRDLRQALLINLPTETKHLLWRVVYVPAVSGFRVTFIFFLPQTLGKFSVGREPFPRRITPFTTLGRKTRCTEKYFGFPMSKWSVMVIKP